MANALPLPIEVTDAEDAEDAGARGAAIMADIGIGIYQDVEDAATKAVRLLRTHHPDQEWKALPDRRYGRFLRLMAAARDTAIDPLLWPTL